MENTVIEFLDVPKNSLDKIYQNRVIDWHEDTDHILHLFEKHAENYRKKICVKCSNEQKIIRECCTTDEIDSNGNPKTWCRHMGVAGCKKLKPQIDKHIDFHPMFFNSSLQEQP